MPHRLESFLKRRLPGARSITVGGYEPLLGGYTRLTARFRVSVDGVDTWHVVRGDPPPERSIADTDRNAEWRLLTSLHGLGEVPIPAPEHVDPDGSELGTRAIVSSFIPGDSLVARGRAADEDELRRLSGSLAETAARIHRTDVTGLPGDLAVPDSWDSYLDSCIQRWRDLYATHVQSDPFLRYVASWLDRNRPPAAPLTLVHGDFQTSNIKCGPNGELITFDWELGHIGDPREDLGWCLVNEAMQPPNLIGRDQDSFCAAYAEYSGLDRDVVNPRTLAYFAILSTITPCQLSYPAIAAFAEGHSNSLQTAYVLGFVTTWHAQWLQAIGELDLPPHP